MPRLSEKANKAVEFLMFMNRVVVDWAVHFLTDFHIDSSGALIIGVLGKNFMVLYNYCYRTRKGLRGHIESNILILQRRKLKLSDLPRVSQLVSI